MSVSMFFDDTLHMLPLGHAIVLVVFCGGGLGFVGWVKQRLGDPLVNTACSLTSLAMITVLTKEGDIQQGDLSFRPIARILKMLLLGVTSTFLVCLFIFPQSARLNLRKVMVDFTDSLSDMLAIITESFLRGDASLLQIEKFKTASDNNKKAYTQLDKILKEAKLEHFVNGTERQYRLEKNLVRCIQDLSENIGGLRSAATLQFDLLKQPASPRQASQGISSNPNPHAGWHGQGQSFTNAGMSLPLFSPILRGSHDLLDPYGLQRVESPDEELQLGESEQRPQSQPNPLVQTPADILEVFIYHLGPSMNSLAFTLKEILSDLPYGPPPDYPVSLNSSFHSSLDRALELYKNSRSEALKTIYTHKDMGNVRGTDVEADMEEVAASCGHFSFSLQEFGEQLRDFLTTLDLLQNEVENRPVGKTWNWLRFWEAPEIQVYSSYSKHRRHLFILAGSTNAKTTAHGSSTTLSENVATRDQDFGIKPLAKSKTFPLQNTYRYKIWRLARRLRKDDMKFATKVGVGAALYALPAFLASTRPIYTHWRGEWGLLSYMIVCSMTIGASNTTGFSRFFGTSLGAVLALVAWELSGANAVVLAFFGWLMATWTSYIIVAKGKGPMGRFIMLTYNLIVLYAYSLVYYDSDGDEDEGGEHPIISEIALHRFASVLAGIIWGIVITRFRQEEAEGWAEPALALDESYMEARPVVRRHLVRR
ncbi:Aluminum-activated malate transporter 1 [Ascosphaera atra]|nr:Aluminum-activated malate transporter 1 [Ascosphaera atra]